MIAATDTVMCNRGVPIRNRLKLPKPLSANVGLVNNWVTSEAFEAPIHKLPDWREFLAPT
jgi:hypothetical protein